MLTDRFQAESSDNALTSAVAIHSQTCDGCPSARRFANDDPVFVHTEVVFPALLPGVKEFDNHARVGIGYPRVIALGSIASAAGEREVRIGVRPSGARRNDVLDFKILRLGDPHDNNGAPWPTARHRGCSVLKTTWGGDRLRAADGMTETLMTEKCGVRRKPNSAERKLLIFPPAIFCNMHIRSVLARLPRVIG